jgi:hypothetical protein
MRSTRPDDRFATSRRLCSRPSDGDRVGDSVTDIDALVTSMRHLADLMSVDDDTG